MADPILETPEQTSFLNMSDEEMRNMPAPTSEAPVSDVVTDPVVASSGADEGDVPTDPPGSGAEGDDAKDGGTPAAKSEPVAPVGDVKVEKASTATEVDAGTKEPAKDPAAINYEAEYQKLLAPFKANGRDIQVNSVDDAVALMQMGANYNKKMAALKPNLKLMKMLENNGFLSEDKIGFLIDLGKKNPDAINKLVKDSGIDPMDLDAEKASTYKQTTYAVDDREIELDTVLDELQGSPSYTRTLDVVSNKWDVASKQAVSQSPQLLRVINDHMTSGIYDLISKEVERDRVFGRLNGMSDIEAYRQTGDAIQARGGFNHLTTGQGKATPQAPEIVQPKAKVIEDDKLKDKRRAASSTQPAAPSTTRVDANSLSMSDEEFSKMANQRFR